MEQFNFEECWFCSQLKKSGKDEISTLVKDYFLHVDSGYKIIVAPDVSYELNFCFECGSNLNTSVQNEKCHCQVFEEMDSKQSSFLVKSGLRNGYNLHTPNFIFSLNYCYDCGGKLPVSRSVNGGDESHLYEKEKEMRPYPTLLIRSNGFADIYSLKLNFYTDIRKKLPHFLTNDVINLITNLIGIESLEEIIKRIGNPHKRLKFNNCQNIKSSLIYTDVKLKYDLLVDEFINKQIQLIMEIE